MTRPTASAGAATVDGPVPGADGAVAASWVRRARPVVASGDAGALHTGNTGRAVLRGRILATAVDSHSLLTPALACAVPVHVRGTCPGNDASTVRLWRHALWQDVQHRLIGGARGGVDPVWLGCLVYYLRCRRGRLSRGRAEDIGRAQVTVPRRVVWPGVPDRGAPARVGGRVLGADEPRARHPFNRAADRCRSDGARGRQALPLGWTSLRTVMACVIVDWHRVAPPSGPPAHNANDDDVADAQAWLTARSPEDMPAALGDLLREVLWERTQQPDTRAERVSAAAAPDLLGSESIRHFDAV